MVSYNCDTTKVVACAPPPPPPPKCIPFMTKFAIASFSLFSYWIVGYIPGCCSSWSSSSLAIGILSLSLLSRTKIMASTSLKRLPTCQFIQYTLSILVKHTHSNVPTDFDIFLGQTYHTHEMIFYIVYKKWSQ